MDISRKMKGMILASILLLGYCEADGQKIKQMLDSVSSSRLLNHVKILEAAGGTNNRVMYTRGYDSVASYVKRTFESYRGLTHVEYDTFYIPSATSPYNLRPLFNVTAMLEGKKDPTKILVVGAHLDACAPRDSGWSVNWSTVRTPGADDNASGAAGVMEVARVLSDTMFHWINDYSILFMAFGAEELVPVYTHWTYGSLHAAEQLKQSGKNVIGAIILDMIGYNSNYDYAAIVSNASSEWMGRACLDANIQYGIGLLMNSPPFPSHEASDHASFWAYSMPSILLIENYLPTVENEYYKKNTLYHTSSDTSGSLNAELMAKITRLTLAAAAGMATSSASGVARISDPVFYQLLRAFPNPFNPSTAIEYAVEQDGPVRLEIFDLLGRSVAILVDEEKPAGTYRTLWNAGSLAGGMYFCRLQNADRYRSIRMILEK
jgi:hypothetical protein